MCGAVLCLPCPLERGGRGVGIAQLPERLGFAQRPPGVAVDEGTDSRERGQRVVEAPQCELRIAAPVEGDHSVLGPVEPAPVHALELPAELGDGLFVSALRGVQRAEQPVETDTREPVAGRTLQVLVGRAQADERIGRPELATRDVDHRHLEPRVGELRVGCHGALERPDARGSPRRVAQPVLVTPAFGVDRDRSPGCGVCLVVPCGAREQE